MRRRFLLALVVAGALCSTGVGCNSEKKQPKVESGKDTDIKPLPPPGLPGGGEKKTTPGPGAQ
jgi:hypothetical protein